LVARLAIRSSASPYPNTGLGINLAANNTVEPNDLGDAPDTGATNLQNYPVLSTIRAAGGNTNIIGKLNSAPQIGATSASPPRH
jgi:hypothetical protein